MPPPPSSLAHSRLDVVQVYHQALEKALLKIYHTVAEDSLLHNPHISDLSAEIVASRISQLVRGVFDNQKEAAFVSALQEIDRLNSYCFELQQENSRVRELEYYNTALQDRYRAMEQHLQRLTKQKSTEKHYQYDQQSKQSNKLRKQKQVIEALRDEIKQAQGQKASLRVEAQTATADLKRAREQCSRIKFELQKATRSNSACLLGLQEQSKRSRQQEELKDRCLKQKQHQIQKLLDRVGQLQAEATLNIQQKQRVVVLSREAHELELAKVLSQLRESKQLLNEKLEQGRKAQAYFDQQVRVLRHQLFVLGERLTQADRARVVLSQELIVSKKTSRQFECRCQSFRQQVCRLREIQKAHKSLHKAANKQRSESQLAKELLLKRQDELQNSGLEAQRLGKQIQNLNSLLHKLTTQKLDLANQQFKAKEQLETCRSKLEKAKTTQLQLEQLKARARDQAELQAKKQAQYQTTFKQNRQLLLYVQQCNIKLQDANMQYSQLQKQHKNQQQLQAVLKLKLNEQYCLCQKTNETLRLIQKQALAAKTLNQDLKQKMEQQARTEQNSRQLNQVNKGLNNHIKQLQLKLQTSQQETLKLKQLSIQLQSSLQEHSSVSQKLSQRLQMFKQQIKRKIKPILNQIGYLQQFRKGSFDQLGKLSSRTWTFLAKFAQGQARSTASAISQIVQNCNEALSLQFLQKQQQQKSLMAVVANANDEERRSLVRNVACLEERNRAVLQQGVKTRQELCLYKQKSKKYELLLGQARNEWSRERDQLLSQFEQGQSQRAALQQDNERLSRELAVLAKEFKILKKSSEFQVLALQSKIQQLHSQIGRSAILYEDELCLLRKQVALQKENCTRQPILACEARETREVREPASRITKTTEADRILSQLKQQLVLHKKQLASWRQCNTGMPRC